MFLQQIHVYDITSLVCTLYFQHLTCVSLLYSNMWRHVWIYTSHEPTCWLQTWLHEDREPAPFCGATGQGTGRCDISGSVEPMAWDNFTERVWNVVFVYPRMAMGCQNDNQVWAGVPRQREWFMALGCEQPSLQGAPKPQMIRKCASSFAQLKNIEYKPSPMGTLHDRQLRDSSAPLDRRRPFHCTSSALLQHWWVILNNDWLFENGRWWLILWNDNTTQFMNGVGVSPCGAIGRWHWHNYSMIITIKC